MCRGHLHHPGPYPRGPGWLWQGGTSPFPTAFFPTAKGKPLFFSRQLSGEAFPGHQAPACPRIRRDFPVFTAEVALTSDLDFRWWAPYAFHLWFCFSPTNMFYSEALETSSSGIAPGGAGQLRPAVPAGSLLLSRPVLAPGRCRSLL